MTNFQQLITTIEGRGHSLGWIAMKTGANHSTLSMIKNTPGREPRYDLGAALVQLEKETRK